MGASEIATTSASRVRPHTRVMTLQQRVDTLQNRLREVFEVKSGYKDDASQQKLLERHFRSFDRDGSGVVDFDEFSRAMVRLNFVGVQAEVEALFDRFDEDLNGVVSYSEFAQGVFGRGGKAAAATSSSLLARVRDKILDAGGKNGIRTLGVILRRLDQNGNGVLELEVRCEDWQGAMLPTLWRHQPTHGARFCCRSSMKDSRSSASTTATPRNSRACFAPSMPTGAARSHWTSCCAVFG